MADTKFQVSEDPEDILQEISANIPKKRLNAKGDVGIPYEAYKAPGEAGIKSVVPISGGEIRGSYENKKGEPTVKIGATKSFGDLNVSADAIRQGVRNSLKARADMPVGEGRGYLEGQYNPDVTSYRAGVGMPLYGGDFSAGAQRIVPRQGMPMNQFDLMYQRKFASGGSVPRMSGIARNLAAQGRNGDDILVHMNRKEAAGIASLAPGGLTTNPQTGLPEAFNLMKSKYLPTIAAIGSQFLFPGNPWAAAIAAGGTSVAQGNSLQQGLMQGAMAGAGVGVSNALAVEGAAQSATPAMVKESADLSTAYANTPYTAPTSGGIGGDATNFANVQSASDAARIGQSPFTTDAGSLPPPVTTPSGIGSLTDAQVQSYNPVPQELEVVPRVIDNAPIGNGNQVLSDETGQMAKDLAQYRGAEGAYQVSNLPPTNPYATPTPNSFLGSERLGNVMAGASNPAALKNALLSRNGLMLGLGAIGASGMLDPKNPNKAPDNIMSSSYRPISAYDRKVSFAPAGYDRRLGEYNYFPGDRYARYAMGGQVDQPAVPLDLSQNYPGSNIMKSSYASIPSTNSQEVVDGYGPKINPFTGAEKMAGGGYMDDKGNSTTFNDRGAVEKFMANFTGVNGSPQGMGFSGFLSNPEIMNKLVPPTTERDKNAAKAAYASGGIATFDQGGDISRIREIRRSYSSRAQAEKDAMRGGDVAKRLGLASADDPALNYAFGPRQHLDGKGDGMSDSIPATIEGRQPALLSKDEFVVPADVVSHLGNGSSEAGADKLYKMLDKVRMARTGTKKQGKQILPEKYLPA